MNQSKSFGLSYMNLVIMPQEGLRKIMHLNIPNRQLIQ